MATEDEVMAIEEEDMGIEEDHMAIEDENTDNMRAEEKVEKCQYGQETMLEPERPDCLVSQVLLSCLVWTVTQRQWSVSNLQTSALLAQAGTQILQTRDQRRRRDSSGGRGRGGEEVQVSDNLPGKERPGGRGNQKRKRSDDTSLPPKRIKKCRALHGLDQKELWCQPCINSKEMC